MIPKIIVNIFEQYTFTKSCTDGHTDICSLL
jgi:hypothetical protein